MATMYDRLLKLEEKAASEPIELTAEQVALIEKANPCYRERHVESSRPGELLAQDTFFVGHLKGVGKVYLQAVVDTYGSYAFGFLHTGKLPECAVAVLHNDVLPFYKELGLDVQVILIDNGREYCGKDTHPYELYLALNDIEHRRTKVGRPQTNGFLERFNRTAWTSSSVKPSGRSSMNRSRPSRPTSTPGSSTTTPRDLTEATGTWGDGPLRRSTCTWRVSREKVNRTIPYGRLNVYIRPPVAIPPFG
jgi:transposase InsO family protein